MQRKEFLNNYNNKFTGDNMQNDYNVEDYDRRYHDKRLSNLEGKMEKVVDLNTDLLLSLKELSTKWDQNHNEIEKISPHLDKLATDQAVLKSQVDSLMAMRTWFLGIVGTVISAAVIAVWVTG